MKIDNYSVAMNAQYYNLQQDYKEVKVSSEIQEFNNSESKEINKF